MSDRENAKSTWGDNLLDIGEWALKRAMYLVMSAPQVVIELMNRDEWLSYLTAFEAKCRQSYQAALCDALRDWTPPKGHPALTDPDIVHSFCRLENDSRRWVVSVIVCNPWSEQDWAAVHKEVFPYERE